MNDTVQFFVGFKGTQKSQNKNVVQIPHEKKI